MCDEIHPKTKMLMPSCNSLFLHRRRRQAGVLMNEADIMRAFVQVRNQQHWFRVVA
jgi:hypothetical protein